MRLLAAALLLLVLLPGALGEKYTRERSEELFHLIDWRNYTSAAFDEALREQKPLYLVLSAPAWCYWCHVYESEDYLYHPQLYPYIDERFIPIFVDSDRRPDLTRKYLEGGWPSTTILAPDGRRINGFTGPREPLALRQYLEQVTAWMEGKTFSAESVDLGYQETEPRIPTEEQLRSLQRDYLALLEGSYDDVHGGYLPGGAPAWREGQKFPAPLADLFLLEEHERTGNLRYLEMVQRTFQEQFTRPDELETRYHLYDPVEGGFHRYATKRDWSVPHYEKLPEDQAKFILLLAELVRLTNDSDARTALDGTLAYMLRMRSEGGFSSSQDAHLEEEYYGKSAEERARLPQPYVDRATRADGQAAMALALLPEHHEDARLALDFLDRMLGERGVLYTYEAGTAVLDGQAVANAWALLALTEGFPALGDEHYLLGAEKVAAFSLSQLYDWRSGGFFERNSQSIAVYAPNERVSLAKHAEENALFAYGMLRLHLLTGKLEYLEAGMKTLGALSMGGIDESYFMAKAARLADEQDLLQRYEELRPAVEALRSERLKDFWVDALLDRTRRGVPLDDAPRLASGLEGAAFWTLALLSFLAGMLSFLSPCCLPLLSAQVAHGVRAGRGRAFLQTALFFLGLAAVFSLFGMGAATLGALLREHRLLFTRVAGMLIITLGVMELTGRGFSGLRVRMRKSDTPLGTVLFGGVFALGWSACIGPILASLLLMASTESALRGTVLLSIYALGLATPLLLLSLWADRQRRIWAILKGRPVTLRIGGWRLETHSTSLLSGALLILLGSLIFLDALYALNRLALQTGYVQRIILGAEQWMARWLL